MKTYYNEYYAMNTEEGKALFKELNEVLSPIIKREFEAGFNPSEIYDVIVGIANLELAALRLKYGCHLMKTKREWSAKEIMANEG